MAKGFDVLHVKSATKARNKFDLSRSHLTTMNFGEIVPLMVEETIPGDKFSVGANYFSRMAPLVKPTYGKFQFKTVAGFVPYHQVADDAEAWLAGKTLWEGSNTHPRQIKAQELAKFIVNYCATASYSHPTEGEVEADANNCDFGYYTASGTLKWMFFTPKGRYWVKILNALGYAVPQNMSLQSDISTSWPFGNTYLNAYPLLAFFKLYNDYMSQSQRYNTSDLSQFLKLVKHGTTTNGFVPGTGEILATGMKRMFDLLKLNYDNDYFTSAWLNPNSPLGSLDSTSSVSVPGSTFSTVEAAIDDNKLPFSTSFPVSNSSVNVSFAIGQRALDFLKSFDDWVRRNNYSGSRAVQQVYSRFGIKTDDYRSNYAHVIGTESTPVQVGDVTSTSDTNGAILGEYAGKGIMNDQKGFQFSADDYGLLIVLGYFTVSPMNAYGFDRRVLRNQPLDFYNPEFDGLGADAISYGEVFTNCTASRATDNSKDDTTFGFTERYNSYRYGRDVITGDFRNYHTDGDMNTWHTGRLLNDVRKAGTMLAQSSAMNTMESTDNQYNRIFSITDDYEDKFYLTAQFKVDAVRPMLSLNQVVGLGEGDTTVPRNGNVIS